MRAKTINEIKRGADSALGSIGVGHSTFLKGAAYIRHNWPSSILTQMMNGTNELKTYVPLNSSVIKDVAKWDFHCNEDELITIQKGLCPMRMDEWIDQEVSKDILVYKDLPESYENFARVFYSKEWNVAEIEIRNSDTKKLVRTYYIIRYK